MKAKTDSNIIWGEQDKSSYMYVSATADNAFVGGDKAWIRMPAELTYWTHSTDDMSTITQQTTPLDLHVQGDIRSEKFEQHLLNKFNDIIEDRLQSFFKEIITMFGIDLGNIRPAGLGPVKKHTDGMFCFNCGAAIERGKECEPCEYCGR